MYTLTAPEIETVHVAVASHDDIPAIVEMGRRFFAVSGYDEFMAYRGDTAELTFKGLIDNPDGVILLLKSGSRILGAAAALLYPFFFNADHKHGHEFFWWVDPEARGDGKLLLRNLENWAKDNGAKTFAVSALATLRPAILQRFYERAGYVASDATYLKGL